MSKYGALTRLIRIWRGSPAPVCVTDFPVCAAMPVNEVACFCQSRKFSAEIPLRRPPGGFSQSWTSCSGSG
jgi:hypothetical protein